MKHAACAVLAILLASCSGTPDDVHPSGTFETREIVVSSEASGRILSFPVEEGAILDSGAFAAAIDSVQPRLKKLQLLKSRGAVLARRPDVGKQIAALEQQIATARTERRRVERLLAADAANRKQLDDIDAQIAVLTRQLDAQRSSLQTSDRGITEESDALSIQVAQIDDQLAKCRVSNPMRGTVLEKYAEAGEFAVAGKPLYRVADLDRMVLRAYVVASQLSSMKIGQKVTVVSEEGSGAVREHEGTVSWISSRAEFTPRTILTRDERDNLVYAVKVAVPNDGSLRIGMYGSLRPR